MRKEVILPAPQGDLAAPAGDGAVAELWHQVFSPSAARSLQGALQDQIAWRRDAIQMYGRTLPIPRLHAWYGDPGCVYTYSRITLQPQPWIQPLLIIKARVEALCDRRFNSVLLNWYRDGDDAMSWHSDDEPELGPEPVIASVSLGAERIFKLRRKPHQKGNPSRSVPLPDGSVLVMAGTTQAHYEHALARTAKPVGGRINLTFREIASP